MRFIIYDTQLLYCEALTTLLLRRGHAVASTPTTPAALVTLATTPEIDACLVSLPESTAAAVNLVRQIKDVNPFMTVIAISAKLDAGLLWQVLETGADGACLKVDPIDEIEGVLLRAATRPRSGVRVASPVLSPGASAIVTRRHYSSAPAALTPKERSVLAALISGASTTAIAQCLGVGEATVRTHLQHLFNKFGVHSRLALVAEAVRAQIIPMQESSAVAANHG